MLQNTISAPCRFAPDVEGLSLTCVCFQRSYTYGQQMSLHMAAGMLFLGGGGFTLSRCDTYDVALMVLWKVLLGNMAPDDPLTASRLLGRKRQ